MSNFNNKYNIFPNCYHKEHNHILYWDNTEKMLFENDKEFFYR